MRLSGSFVLGNKLWRVWYLLIYFKPFMSECEVIKLEMTFMGRFWTSMIKPYSLITIWKHITKDLTLISFHIHST